MDCNNCKTNILSLEDVCFYDMGGEKSVHLIIRPERTELVDERFEIEDTPGKKKNVNCRGCQASLGKKLPIGPSDYSPISFGNVKVVLCGLTLSNKVKWHTVYTTPPYNTAVQLRDQSNFFEQAKIDSPPKRQKIHSNTREYIKFPDPHDPSAFSYEDNLKSDRSPYPYQVTAYIEALQRDLIVVLPTGYGKTLIASLVTAKMIELNPGYMVLFIVDRIPLVFQQGFTISRDTQLEVCALTSETNTFKKRTELVDGDFQVLVATAGAYYDGLEKMLGIERFCCVIIDECHHTTKGHIYVRILDLIKTCDPHNRPRVLGLTASPPSVKGNFGGTKQSLFDFQSHFLDAPICHNLLKDMTEERNDAKLDIREITEEEDQPLLEYRSELYAELERLAKQINSAFGGTTLIKSEYWTVKRSRPNLIKILKFLNCHFNEDIDRNVKSMSKIFDVLEITELLGITDKNKSLEEMAFHQNLNNKTIYSSRFLFLLEILKELPQKSKIIVFVRTRAIAQILSTLLKGIPEIDDKFSPQKIVGQYGPLGMSWEREQEEIIKRFRGGNCNLLVSTSVLEEGQDIPCCDVVIRFDGIQTLISYTQTKGRARHKDSRFILILSESEHQIVKEIEDQDLLVKHVLESNFTNNQVPSNLTGEIREEVFTTIIRSNKPDKVIQTSECAVEFYFSGTYDEFDLKTHIANFFKEKYFLNLTHFDIKKFDSKWKGRYIFPVTDTLLNLGLETHSAGIYEQYKLLTIKWDFSLEKFPDNIWTRIVIHPTEESKKNIMRRSWSVYEIVWGIFKDRNTFLTRRLEEFDKGTTLSIDDSHLIIRTKVLLIEIALVSIHRFILADWDEKTVRLYLPLTYPPEVRPCTEDAIRYTSIECETLLHFGEYPVFGITLPYNADDWAELWILLHASTIFPVPLFESRVNDEVEQPMETNADIPIHQNPDYWEIMMQNCMWQYSILKENRNVCLPVGTLARMRHELASAGPSDLPSINQTLEALLIQISKTGTHYFFDWENTFQKELKDNKQNPPTLIIPCKENYCYKECAIVTPSRTIPLHPILTQCNRLFRKYPDERFLNLAFRDESQGELNSRVLKRVEDALYNGISVDGVEFYFFVCSSSQLRSKRAIFIQLHDLNKDEINEKIEKMRNELIGKCDITNETKFLSRLGLFCTTDTPTCEIQKRETECLEDLRADNNLLVTDGAGKMKRSLAVNVLKKYGNETVTVETASALQIRLAGLKGVFTIVDDDTDPDFKNYPHCNILYRKSMKKIEWTHSTLCAVKVGKFSKVCMNIQMLNLLTSLEDPKGLWDPKPRIKELHEKEMSEFAKIFIDPNRARNELGGYLKKDTLDVFNVLCEPYFLKLLRCVYTYNIRNLISKVHIPIPLSVGCILMGIPDPIGVLEDDEVFITYIDKEKKRNVREGRILIYKNPCLHPGDLLTPTGVDREELHFLHNVIVFPIKGKTSIPACSGGGDLDGDEFAVIWDEAFIPPKDAIFPPQNYDEVLSEAKKELALERKSQGLDMEEKPVQNDPKILERLTEGYIRIISNDLLGTIAHYHLSICEQRDDGARDDLAIELSQKATLAVDSPKTGIIPKIPNEALAIIRDKGFPDFMEKDHLNFFISTKLLGDLYHRAKDVCYKTSEWVNILNYFEKRVLKERVPGNFQLSLFEIPGYEEFMEDAKSKYHEYSSAFQQIMLAFGIETEAEVVTGLIIKCHPLLSADKGKTMSALAASFDHLTEEFRAIFHHETPKEKYQLKAAAWYITVYKLALQKEDQFVLHSFAWIVPEYLTGIVKAANVPRFKSESQVLSAIGESGMDYFKKMSDSIRNNVDSKLCVLPKIKETINPQSAQSGASEAQKIFKVKPFGSASVYLCELESDLDLSVSLTDYGETVVFPNREDVALTHTKYRKHILSNYISPKISEIADKKSDMMEVEVPIISFTMRPDEKDQSEVHVDITVESDGVEKNGYIKRLYVETEGVFFVWLWLLVHWARHVGILKCHNSPDSNGIILTAEFEALVLHIYEQMKNTPDQVPYDKKNGKLESLLYSISEKDITHKLGAMIEEFFHRGYELLSNAKDITYKWSIPKSPTHTIFESALKQIAGLLFQGWHCLMFTRDMNKLFERAHNQFHVNHRFSHRMSEILQMYTEFYRKSLADVSGAKIEFQTMGKNILLIGYGSAESLLTLSAEISTLEADSALSKRYKSNANRYMMDGCTTMTVQNSIQDCSIKLNSLNGCFKQKHWNNEKSVVVPEGKETNKNWRKNGIKKIKNLLSKQLEKFPDNDANLLEKLQLKTRFGFFYVLDGRAAVESTGSLPIENLQKCLEEGVKWRKELDSGGEDKDLPGAKKEQSETAVPNDKENNKQNKPKKPSTAKTGINAAFCPGINKIDNQEQAERTVEIYKSSLLECGFKPKEKDSSYTWRVEMQKSTLQDIRYNLDENLEIIDISERPIIWLLATIVGDRRTNDKAHDLRIRAESAKTLEIEGKGSNLFTVREDGSPQPCDGVKQRLKFIKRSLGTSYFEFEDSIAKISYGVEYSKDNSWKCPHHYCELSMYHSSEVLRRSVQAGNSSIQIQDLADRAIQLSLRVSDCITKSLSS